jgi:ornithine carbamoyltransferase
VKRDFLSIEDFSEKEIKEIFARTRELKKNKYSATMKNKILALIFEKASTRTRVSFETGIKQLGGDSIFIDPGQSQLGRGEEIKDTARVLSGYVDLVVIRTFEQERLEEFAKYSSIPVINGLTDLRHPCQVLTDIFTIMEFLGNIEGKTVAFIGDGNNMMNSWITALLRLDFTLFCAFPQNYEPDKDIVSKCEKEGKGKLILTDNPVEAVKYADVVNTDVWASMGQENEQSLRKELFQDFQINSNLLSKCKKEMEPIVLHCLPAHKGEEITEDVFEKNSNYIFTQAENRLHVQKAIMEKLFI